MSGQRARTASIVRIGPRLLLGLLVSLAAFASCIRREVVLPEADRLPHPDQLVLPVPGEVYAMADTATETAMKNVLFHVDDDILLRIAHLRGRMQDLRGEHTIVLDDKNSLLLTMTQAEIGLTAEALTMLLNRYVFGYRGSPIRSLIVKIEDDHVVQTGIMHKIIDIPFEMNADLSVTEEGLVRLRPTSMKIAGLDGVKLLKAVDRTLADMLDLSGAKGVSVEGNDLLLDPLEILPPPRIEGTLTAIRVEGDQILQTFGSPGTAGAEPLAPPVPANNYIYFRGGSIRFGKLYTVLADLEAIDTDEDDWFDFYLDHYHTQLVAGYHVTMPNYGLVTWMPDFDDIGTPKGVVTPLTKRN